MLEPDPVQRVVQLDVDAQIIGIELELVAGRDPAILGDVEQQGRDAPVYSEAPVLVSFRLGIEGDHRFLPGRDGAV